MNGQFQIQFYVAVKKEIGTYRCMERIPEAVTKLCHSQGSRFHTWDV